MNLLAPLEICPLDSCKLRNSNVHGSGLPYRTWGYPNTPAKTRAAKVALSIMHCDPK
jgi:hypothetical protein